jgi:hypothetical protein
MGESLSSPELLESERPPEPETHPGRDDDVDIDVRGLAEGPVYAEAELPLIEADMANSAGRSWKEGKGV